MPTIIIDNFTLTKRDDLITLLDEENIDARPFFHPLSSLPMFEEKLENHIAYVIGMKGINLPSHHDLTFDEVKKVVTVIKTQL